MNPSNLKFLVDMGVGKKIEDYLHENSFDVKSTRDIDIYMPDSEIIRIAKSEERMIITMDKDFGELVYHSGLKHCGVLLLRLEEAGSEEKLQVISRIIENFSERIKDHFCVYKNSKLRIRKI